MTVEPAGDLTSKRQGLRFMFIGMFGPSSLLSVDSDNFVMKLLSLQAGRDLGDNSVKPLHSIDEKIRDQEQHDLSEVTKPHPGVFS